MLQLTLLDLGLLIVVAWMLALGAGAIVFGLLRPRITGRALVLFGLFSGIYGTRIASGLSFMPSLPFVSPAMAQDGRQALTYLVLLPLMLLVEQLIGRGWRGTMRATVWLQVAYTVVGVVTAGFAPIDGWFEVAKPYIVLVIGTSALANILIAFRRMHDVPKSLIAGFVIFLGTVGVYNAGLIVGRPDLARIEIFGYVPFVGCLGYAVAVYVLQTETRLLVIDREVEAAQRIQAAILPDALPAVPGLAIAARYRPMSTMAGDFYDTVRIDERRVGLLIADALGHGLAASLIAAMVKVAFSATVPAADDPGEVLSGMNSMLVRPLGRDREFVTAVYIVLDQLNGRLSYARAGHPPPLLLRQDGTLTTLDEGGTILGKFAGLRYDTATLALDPGSRILLYTDGVVEAANRRGESFGVDRLTAHLTASRDRSADACADGLLAAVVAFGDGRPLEDDVTIIVIDSVAVETARPGEQQRLVTA